MPTCGQVLHNLTVLHECGGLMRVLFGINRNKYMKSAKPITYILFIRFDFAVGSKTKEADWPISEGRKLISYRVLGSGLLTKTPRSTNSSFQIFALIFFWNPRIQRQTGRMEWWLRKQFARARKSKWMWLTCNNGVCRGHGSIYERVR